MQPPVPHSRDASEIDLSGDPDGTAALAVEQLEGDLNYHFSRSSFLIQALTHRSLLAEDISPHGTREDNERLEYLGDAVVGLVVAESLYRRFPDLQEGELTRLRGALVSREHLAKVAGSLDLGSYLQLGRGEKRTRGRAKRSLLANAMEAVIGAVYLDAGLDAARRIIEAKVIEPDVDLLREQMGEGGSLGDFKSALQQLLQSRKQGQPEYRTTAEAGPDHHKCFYVEVRAGGEVLAEGSGPTRKAAEQEAARGAMQQIRQSGAAE
ncbi:MAG TPA: ribonuclease III [Acidobacteriaceae bacterium]|nr:ribonuclease III [Acidobacteriaceae bacterium]